MIANLKEKANKLKGEAESGFEKAKEYFEEIKGENSDVIKHKNEMVRQHNCCHADYRARFVYLVEFILGHVVDVSYYMAVAF